MKIKKEGLNKTIIYQGKNGEIKFRGDFSGETVWGNLNQIADLFGRDKSVISRHIKNIFNSQELAKNSVVAKIATTASDGKTYQTSYYNLDLILSVGYRVDSKQATVFRRWATKTLKQHLLRGYTVNQKRLEQAQEKFLELQETISFLQNKSTSKNLKGQSGEILSLLGNYSKSLTLLEQFDKDIFKKKKGKKDSFVLNYKKAKNILIEVKTSLIKNKEATELFASERGDAFAGIIGNIYQTFGQKELYRNIEEKAAHLLYFTIKDHPFSDGNKRSGAFLFVYFLDKNKYLYKKSGERKINDNALVALALLVAESDPKEKELMIKLIINLIGD